MQVTDRTARGRLPVRPVELRDRVGSYIERPDGARLVLFRRDGQRSSCPVTIDVPDPGKPAFWSRTSRPARGARDGQTNRTHTKSA
jgi:hypothetical protein